MKHEDKRMAMRGNNRPFTRNVVPHELLPGHHLQGSMAAREPPYRCLFSTPFFVEGWSLYWEMRFYSLAYQTTPEDRIGALFWRMHRSVQVQFVQHRLPGRQHLIVLRARHRAQFARKHLCRPLPDAF